MYLYLDESGDLGFGKKSSKFFVVTILFTKNPRYLSFCIKKARHKKLKKKLKERPEIKAYTSTQRIRELVLSCLAKKDIEVHTIVLSKRNIPSDLRREKQKLYNYITGLLIEDCAHFLKPSLTLIVDKRATGKVLEEFNDYVRFKAASQMIEERKTLLKIHHKISQSDAGLQAVDFVSYAIYRLFEHGKDDLYSIIEPKVKTMKKLFFKEKSGPY